MAGVAEMVLVLVLAEVLAAVAGLVMEVVPFQAVLEIADKATMEDWEPNSLGIMAAAAEERAVSVLVALPLPVPTEVAATEAVVHPVQLAELLYRMLVAAEDRRIIVAMERVVPELEEMAVVVQQEVALQIPVLAAARGEDLEEMAVPVLLLLDIRIREDRKLPAEQ